MQIGKRTIGEEVYVIAEAGMNHGGSLRMAEKLAKAAKDAGASAIKFQTYEADDLVVKGTPKFWNYEEDENRDQHEAYEAIKKLSWKDTEALMKYCDKIDIEFLSTPFSFETATKLNEMGMRAFKIASSDMSTLPFLRHIARFGKPILLSTGAATQEEVDEAVETIKAEGNPNVVVMQCTLCYPTKDEDANLGVLMSWGIYKDYAVGLSDHTLSPETALIASAYGATVIEKHFTLDKETKGNADHKMSVTPDQLKEMVQMTRWVNKIVGNSKKEVLECEKETRLYDKRSVVTKQDIPKDTVITPDMLTFKRPGTGIWPNQLKTE